MGDILGFGWTGGAEPAGWHPEKRITINRPTINILGADE
jgi:hypothetical protein